MKIKNPKYKVGQTVKAANGKTGKISEISISITESTCSVDYFVSKGSCESCGNKSRDIFEETEVTEIVLEK